MAGAVTGTDPQPPVGSRLSDCDGGITTVGMKTHSCNHVRDDRVLWRVCAGKVSL